MPTVSTAVGRCKQNTKNSSTETEVPSVPRQTGSRGQGQVSRGKLRMGLGSGARLAPLPRLPGPHRDPRPPPSGKRRGPGPCPSCCGLQRWVPGARTGAHTEARWAATSGVVLSGGRGRYLGLPRPARFLLGHVRACICRRKMEQEAKLEGQLLTAL